MGPASRKLVFQEHDNALKTIASWSQVQNLTTDKVFS